MFPFRVDRTFFGGRGEHRVGGEGVGLLLVPRCGLQGLCRRNFAVDEVLEGFDVLDERSLCGQAFDDGFMSVADVLLTVVVVVFLVVDEAFVCDLGKYAFEDVLEEAEGTITIQLVRFLGELLSRGVLLGSACLLVPWSRRVVVTLPFCSRAQETLRLWPFSLIMACRLARSRMSPMTRWNSASFFPLSHFSSSTFTRAATTTWRLFDEDVRGGASAASRGAAAWARRGGM